MLYDADAWGRFGGALGDALAVQLAVTPGIAVPDITVLVVLGDPGDAHFMGPNLGMTANGGVSGYVFLNFWPYPENLARLEATAVHELSHNLRYSSGGVVWDPATVTVGEHVVSEGLADAFRPPAVRRRARVRARCADRRRLRRGQPARRCLPGRDGPHRGGGDAGGQPRGDRHRARPCPVVLPLPLPERRSW